MLLSNNEHTTHVPALADAAMVRRLAADAEADTEPPTDGDTLPSPSCTRSLTDADADSGTAEKVTEPVGDDAAE
jgi:hypothetical protein